jgi:hypothetical protein
MQMRRYWRGLLLFAAKGGELAAGVFQARIRVASKLAKLALVRAELHLRKERGRQVAKPQYIKVSIFKQKRWIQGHLLSSEQNKSALPFMTFS